MKKIYGFFENRFYFSDNNKLKYTDSNSNIHIKEDNLDNVCHIWNGKDYSLVINNKVLSEIVIPQNWNVCFKSDLSKIKNQEDLLSFIRKHEIDLMVLEVDGCNYYGLNVDTNPTVIFDSDFNFKNIELFSSSNCKYLKINNRLKKCKESYLYFGANEIKEDIDFTLDYKIKTYEPGFYDSEQDRLYKLLSSHNKLILNGDKGRYIILKPNDVVYDFYYERYLIKTTMNKFYIVDFLQNTITETKLEKLDNLIELDSSVNPKNLTYSIFIGCKHEKDYIHIFDWYLQKSYLYRLENNKLSCLNLINYDTNYISSHIVKNNDDEHYLIDDNGNILGTVW